MGKLILVPTPIGNLEDITLRALKTLKSADLILAEDTRKTRILLKKHNIENRLMPYHQHNEHRIAGSIVKRVKESENIALVTDAGTPGISDPGFLLVRACINEGVEVESLPGPSAFIPALVNSGFPCDRFCFEGFLPHKKGRKKRLLQLREESRTIIFYESPFRVIKLLKELAEIAGMEREVSVSRELTKIHEETLRGTLEAMITRLGDLPSLKGEFVVVLSGKS